MKVPHSVVGRTQPSSQGQAYFEDHSDKAFRGLQQLAGAFGSLGAQLQQRAEQVDKFSAIQVAEQTEQDLLVGATEQARAAEPNDMSLLERQEAYYDNMTAEALKKIPASQQEEYRARFAQQKTQFMAGALKFQYERQDQWFNEGIKESMTTGQLAVDKDWNEENVTAQINRVNEKIDASGLPEEQKLRLKKENELMMRQTQFGKALKENQIDGKPLTTGRATGKKVAGGDRGKQLAFVWHELGTDEQQTLAELKRAKTVEQAVAAGIGYERPQGWTPQYPQGGHGFKQRVAYARSVLNGTATPEAMQARAYFESQGLSPVAAAGMVGNLMQESGPSLNPNAKRDNDAGPGQHSIGIGQWNRARLAKMQAFTGQQGEVDLPDGSGLAIEDDPRFANIPLEQREAMKNDARIYRSRAAAEATALAQEQRDAYVNQALIDTYKGKLGKADHFRMFESGQIDYSDLTKLEEAWNKNNQNNKNLTEGLLNVEQGRPNSAEQDNAIAEAQGDLDGIQKRDPAAYEKITQRTSRTQTLAPVTQNMLGSMMTSRNPADAAYAYKLMTGVYDASKTAFDKLPEAMKQNVLAYREMLNSGMSDLEAAKSLRGGDTPAEQQMHQQIKEQGAKTYNDSKLRIFEHAPKKLQSIADNDGTLGTSAYVPDPIKYEFSNWYQTMWVENYAKFGSDAEKATAATDALADSVWKISRVGDFPHVGRFVPEAVGYKQYEGSFDWMRKQLEDQLGLKEGEKVALVADDMTRTQVANWQAGGLRPNTAMDKLKGGINSIAGHDIFMTSPPTPTWGVIRFDANGLPRYNPKTERVTFQQTNELDQRETEVMDYRDLEAKWADIFTDWRAEQADAAQEGRPPNEELRKAFEAIDAQVNSERSRLYPEEPPEEAPDPANPQAGKRRQGIFGTGSPSTSQRTVKQFFDAFRAENKKNELRPQYELPSFSSKTMEAAKRRWPGLSEEQIKKRMQGMK